MFTPFLRWPLALTYWWIKYFLPSTFPLKIFSDLFQNRIWGNLNIKRFTLHFHPTSTHVKYGLKSRTFCEYFERQLFSDLSCSWYSGNIFPFDVKRSIKDFPPHHCRPHCAPLFLTLCTMINYFAKHCTNFHCVLLCRRCFTLQSYLCLFSDLLQRLYTVLYYSLLFCTTLNCSWPPPALHWGPWKASALPCTPINCSALDFSCIALCCGCRCSWRKLSLNNSVAAEHLW